MTVVCQPARQAGTHGLREGENFYDLFLKAFVELGVVGRHDDEDRELLCSEVEERRQEARSTRERGTSRGLRASALGYITCVNHDGVCAHTVRRSRAHSCQTSSFAMIERKRTIEEV